MEETPVKSRSVFLPFFALTLAVLFVLFGMYSLASRQKTMLKQALVQRAQTVQQARDIQANLERLVRDVIALAARDADAKAVVEKYQIREQQPAVATTDSTKR